MAFIEDKQMIQALFPRTAYPSLRMRIGVRSAVGCEDGFDALRGENRIKRQFWIITGLSEPRSLVSPEAKVSWVGGNRLVCRLGHSPGNSPDCDDDDVQSAKYFSAGR